jgi:hypothetical protein
VRWVRKLHPPATPGARQRGTLAGLGREESLKENGQERKFSKDFLNSCFSPGTIKFPFCGEGKKKIFS